MLFTDLVAQLLVSFSIKSFVSYEYGKWYIFRNVRLITDFHLLQQQNDYLLIDRPFYHKSIKESHLYYTKHIMNTYLLYYNTR